MDVTLTVIVEVLRDFAPRTLCSRIRRRISFPHVFCFVNRVLVSLELHFEHRYNSLDCNNYFSSPSWSAYHLLILLTTANFPDVMLPTYVVYGVTQTKYDTIATHSHSNTQVQVLRSDCVVLCCVSYDWIVLALESRDGYCVCTLFGTCSRFVTSSHKTSWYVEVYILSSKHTRTLHLNIKHIKL